MFQADENFSSHVFVVERMDPTHLPKIMIHWNPEGRKKTRPSPENLERWNIYSHERNRSKNGRMEQPKAMEYESRKASSDVVKPRNVLCIIYLLLTFICAHLIVACCCWAKHSLIPAINVDIFVFNTLKLQCLWPLLMALPLLLVAEIISWILWFINSHLH
jgi:hypothetical protein